MVVAGERAMTLATDLEGLPEGLAAHTEPRRG